MQKKKKFCLEIQAQGQFCVYFESRASPFLKRMKIMINIYKTSYVLFICKQFVIKKKRKWTYPTFKINGSYISIFPKMLMDKLFLPPCTASVFSISGAFRLYDVDNDGFITRDEMYNIVDAMYEMVVSISF